MEIDPTGPELEEAQKFVVDCQQRLRVALRDRQLD